MPKPPLGERHERSQSAVFPLTGAPAEVKTLRQCRVRSICDAPANGSPKPPSTRLSGPSIALARSPSASLMHSVQVANKARRFARPYAICGDRDRNTRRAPTQANPRPRATSTPVGTPLSARLGTTTTEMASRWRLAASATENITSDTCQVRPLPAQTSELTSCPQSRAATAPSTTAILRASSTNPTATRAATPKLNT